MIHYTERDINGNVIENDCDRTISYVQYNYDDYQITLIPDPDMVGIFKEVIDVPKWNVKIKKNDLNNVQVYEPTEEIMSYIKSRLTEDCSKCNINQITKKIYELQFLVTTETGIFDHELNAVMPIILG